MKRTWRWALLAVVILLVGYPAYLVVRVKFFPTRYDVSSISRLPAYQDPALLRRAWELPVASRYSRALESQRNLSVCGPTSASNALRSLGAGPATADGVVEGTGKCRFLGYCWNGLTLDELAGVVRSKTTRSVTVARDLSLAEFRAQVARANDPRRRVIVNFNRGLLFGQGGGHFSPIGGYLPDLDLVFVLDVNPSFGPWLVPTDRLYRAVDSVDAESHRGRVPLDVEKPGATPGRSSSL